MQDTAHAAGTPTAHRGGILSLIQGNDFSRRNLEFEKEHANGRKMTNINNWLRLSRESFTATVDIGL
jgi:hypothetical protein